MKVTVWKVGNKSSLFIEAGKGNKVHPIEVINLMAYEMGRLVGKTCEPQDGYSMMDILKYIGDEKILPAFLLGAGCRLKEECDG